jgi:hypothetical protein
MNSRWRSMSIWCQVVQSLALVNIAMFGALSPSYAVDDLIAFQFFLMVPFLVKVKDLCSELYLPLPPYPSLSPTHSLPPPVHLSLMVSTSKWSS